MAPPRVLIDVLSLLTPRAQRRQSRTCGSPSLPNLGRVVFHLDPIFPPLRLWTNDGERGKPRRAKLTIHRLLAIGYSPQKEEWPIADSQLQADPAIGTRPPTRPPVLCRVRGPDLIGDGSMPSLPIGEEGRTFLGRALRVPIFLRTASGAAAGPAGGDARWGSP